MKERQFEHEDSEFPLKRGSAFDKKRFNKADRKNTKQYLEFGLYENDLEDDDI